MSGGKAEIERANRCANAPGGEKEGDERVARGMENGDPVSGLDAEAAELGGEEIGFPIEIGKGENRIAGKESGKAGSLF